jgi:hypothetical protein
MKRAVMLFGFVVALPTVGCIVAVESEEAELDAAPAAFHESALPEPGHRAETELGGQLPIDDVRVLAGAVLEPEPDPAHEADSESQAGDAESGEATTAQPD